MGTRNRCASSDRRRHGHQGRHGAAGAPKSVDLPQPREPIACGGACLFWPVRGRPPVSRATRTTEFTFPYECLPERDVVSTTSSDAPAPGDLFELNGRPLQGFDPEIDDIRRGGFHGDRSFKIVLYYMAWVTHPHDEAVYDGACREVIGPV